MCDEGNGFMDIFKALLIWKAGMWIACAVQIRVGVRNNRWGRPHAASSNIHTEHAHTVTPRMRQLCHQTLTLARGRAVWVVGEERRRGAEVEEKGNWWKMGLFHSSLEMLSLACSVCCFPHGFQMLPWAALTQLGCDFYHQAVQHWMLNYWGMVCNMSVVLYTCIAVRAEMCAWVARGCFIPCWTR